MGSTKPRHGVGGDGGVDGGAAALEDFDGGQRGEGMRGAGGAGAAHGGGAGGEAGAGGAVAGVDVGADRIFLRLRAGIWAIALEGRRQFG